MELINKMLWVIATSSILINSIYFSVKLKFPQFKIIRSLKKYKIPKEKDKNISSKDTLIMALSSKIGVGSLSGTALCIYYGGIGTIFWMLLSSFFLSIITYIENELAVIYKENDGIYTKSGPAYYIKKGMNNKKLAVIYAIIMLITYSVFFLAMQNNTISVLTTNIFNINKMLVSLIITITSSIVIIKGLKTISNICNKVFPVMMLLFISIGIFVLIKNISNIPILTKIILEDAFNIKNQGIGIAYSILLALQKSIFANESGVGTSSIISGIANNKNYKSQGIIGIIQTYFINFIVIGITSLIIVTSNKTNINISNGIELTKYAFNFHLSTYGEYLLLVILLLFSYSSIITIYYFGENCLKFLTKNKASITILKAITMLSIFIGGIINSNMIWILIDISLAVLTTINMYAMYKLKETIINKNIETKK